MGSTGTSCCTDDYFSRVCNQQYAPNYTLEKKQASTTAFRQDRYCDAIRGHINNVSVASTGDNRCHSGRNPNSASFGSRFYHFFNDRFNPENQE